MNPPCAPAPRATSAATTTDAMTVTPSRDNNPDLPLRRIGPTLSATLFIFPPLTI